MICVFNQFIVNIVNPPTISERQAKMINPVLQIGEWRCSGVKGVTASYISLIPKVCLPNQSDNHVLCSVHNVFDTCNELHCCALSSYLERKPCYLTIQDKLSWLLKDYSFSESFAKYAYVMVVTNLHFHVNVKDLKQVWKLN